MLRGEATTTNFILIWPDLGSNPRSTALEASSPPMQFKRMKWLVIYNHCVVCFWFWLSFWYLQTLLNDISVTRFLVLWVCFIDLLFVLFLLAIVLCGLLLYTDSHYPFGIVKLFLNHINRVGRLMVSVLDLSVVDREFEPRPGQIKDVVAAPLGTQH